MPLPLSSTFSLYIHSLFSEFVFCLASCVLKLRRIKDHFADVFLRIISIHEIAISTYVCTCMCASFVDILEGRCDFSKKYSVLYKTKRNNNITIFEITFYI